jgi:hypothetical protein
MGRFRDTGPFDATNPTCHTQTGGSSPSAADEQRNKGTVLPRVVRVPRSPQVNLVREVCCKDGLLANTCELKKAGIRKNGLYNVKTPTIVKSYALTWNPGMSWS